MVTAAKLAALFPGQGAQAPGMGKAWYDGFDSVRELYRQAATQLGYDLTALCFEGSVEDLKRTDRCQPAIFVTSIAALYALHESDPGLKFHAAAGLSLGELSALTAAGVLSFQDGLAVVRVRGEAMEEASQQRCGAMSAILGLDGEPLREVCRQTGAEIANLNSPGQVVISGGVVNIELAEKLAKAAGAKRVIRLEVSGAFHSSLMEPASRRLKAALDKVELKFPKTPVVSNVTAEYERSPEEIKINLVRQLMNPTLWEASMRKLAGEGFVVFLELPPGTVLKGLLRRIEPSAQVTSLETPAAWQGFLTTSKTS